jgi:Rrf2 family protein
MLTNKSKYGLKAMVHLAGAEPGKPVLASEIAERNGIPKKFLDAILGELRNAGFVRSRKGPGGGYALSRAPEEIRVGHIIRVLDGSLVPLACATHDAYRPCEDCDDLVACPVRLVMLQVRDAMSSVLDQMTLARMRAMADAQTRTFTYQI